MRKFLGLFLIFFLNTSLAFSFCYPLGDGSVLCVYSRTGLFRITTETMKRLATEPCEGKVVEIYRPDKNWLIALKPTYSVIYPQFLLLDGGRFDTMELCRLKELVEKSLHYKRPAWVGTNSRDIDVIMNIAESWSLEDFSRLAEAGKLGTPGATTPYGVAAGVAAATGMLLDFISWVNIKMIKNKLFVEKPLLDVNYYLDHGMRIQWIALKPGVSKEQFFKTIEKKACGGEKKIFELTVTKSVIFKHNEHLRHVADCRVCHHTGTFENCITCHQIGGLDPAGTLLYFTWYAKAKTCAKCHKGWEPIPWPSYQDENTSYFYQNCLFVLKK